MKKIPKTVVLPTEQIVEFVKLQLAEQNCASLNVTGTSMWPMLKHLQDRVLLKKPEKLKKGDIILYRRENGRYILHRIIYKEAGGYVCSGDNQWEKEHIRESWVIAVVTDFYKKEKRYSICHKGYRLYAWLWRKVFPVRRPILWLARKMYHIRKLFGGKNET